MSNFTTVSYTKDALNKELAKLFTALLEQKIVDAVLAPCRQPSGTVMQTLITDPARTDQVDPFAPVMPGLSIPAPGRLNHSISNLSLGYFSK